MLAHSLRVVRLGGGNSDCSKLEPMDRSPNSIDYGMFIMPFHPLGKPLSQCYDEDLELIVRAEEAGFKEFWIGEHHTMKYESIVMPEIFIARALGETQRIRLGPAPVCLNQHHPAHVASRLSFLDHLSKGRLNICFGNGSVTSDQELYGVDPQRGGGMMFESMEAILNLWQSEPPYEHRGDHWRFQLKDSVDQETQIGFIHKPYQQPHPPIWLPGTSIDSYSMQVAGERGFRPFSHCLVPGNVVANNWATYAAAAQAAGRDPLRSDWRVARSIFLADTTQEAVKRVRSNSLGQNYEYIGKIFDKSPRTPRIQARPKHAGLDVPTGLPADGTDHRRRCRRSASSSTAANRRNGCVRNAGIDEL